MQWTVYLASVGADAVDRCRGTDGTDLAASKVVSCPHDLVNIEVHPLGEVLGELLDVGQPLRNDGWHPLRAPVVIDPETAMARARRLDDAWTTAEPQLRGLMGDALGEDLRAVRDLYAHASANHEWVVSYLSAPDDPTLALRALVPTVIEAPIGP